MSDWTERSRKVFVVVYGIVQLELTAKSEDGTKYAGEIKILGSMIQTGTYPGPIASAKKQIHQDACIVIKRALQDISTNQESPDGGRSGGSGTDWVTVGT